MKVTKKSQVLNLIKSQPETKWKEITDLYELISQEMIVYAGEKRYGFAVPEDAVWSIKDAKSFNRSRIQGATNACVKSLMDVGIVVRHRPAYYSVKTDKKQEE